MATDAVTDIVFLSFPVAECAAAALPGAPCRCFAGAAPARQGPGAGAPDGLFDAASAQTEAFPQVGF